MERAAPGVVPWRVAFLGKDQVSRAAPTLQRMTSGRRVLRQLVLLLLLLMSGCSAGAKQPAAVQGRLDLPPGLQRPVPLQGEWAFAWQQFLDPRWERLPPAAFVPVPSSWNDLDAGGKRPGPDGWGSYALLVNCPAGESLAVEAVGQRTASRLFVNGTPVAAHGEPGPSRAASWAAVHNRVPISREFPCPLRITLHLSNFDHRAGGFVRPLMAGPGEALERRREAHVAYHAALQAAYLLTGVLSLIFFAVRRRERVPLAFGLFCIAMAVYTDMIGERLLLRPLPPQVSWLAYMRVEYLSWIAGMALFTLTIRGLFPLDFHRRVVQVVLATLAVAAAAVLLLPPGVYSHVALPGQTAAVAVAAYVALAMIRAQRHARTDARLLLAGMVAVLVTLSIDLLLIDVPGPDRKFGPLGFALFLLSPAVVIARRLSRALNAEERGRTLEENARLREDVERMSRHDLKTPLNSILGVTRLLRDDPSLGQDQRHLVSVLQRAGLRMLEMVNLSQDLFKMEKGSYEFRIQAVDLQEVVMRVLVDLHSYAQASGVTLHLRGSDREPVRVRGEELLCYSIVANLVKNAVEAAGRGNEVTLTLQRGEAVVLTVHNPGAVPPEIAARFFEKYVSGGKSGGIGMGTYSARLMARVQQGDLTLRTGAGEGTTLTLTLRPLRGEAPAPAAAPAAVPQQDPALWTADIPPRDVLLVDDDEYTRLFMSRFLPSPPFDVQTAENGQEAVEAMATRWPDYLLVDLEMPLRNGVETVRWVREYEAAQGRPRCRVVMLSANDDEASAARGLAAGADRYLRKPVSREALLAAMRQLEDEPGERPPAAGSGSSAIDGAAVIDLPLELEPDSADGLPEAVLRLPAAWIEAFPGYLQAQRRTLDAIARALAEGDRDSVRLLAHRACGAMSLVGLHWAARQCRALEHHAVGDSDGELEQRVVALREHLGKVRAEAA